MLTGACQLKRIKNLYDEVISFENLLNAAHKAQKGKLRNSAIAAFNFRLESNLLNLQEALLNLSYQPGPFRHFIINDRKPRMISAAPYVDRVVHHALCNVIEPIFEKVFIYDSYACRKGKGTHAAVERLTQYMQKTDYALKCDVRKYFPSIDHSILKTLLRKKIGCESTLWLIDKIIDHSDIANSSVNYFAGDNLFSPLERRTGLPLGNQTSQFFANVYLNAMDHYIKEVIGRRQYVRYVDDFVVLGNDKDELWNILEMIQEFISINLRLRLHPLKCNVVPMSEGVDFLGYHNFTNYRRLRQCNVKSFARRLRQMEIGYRKGDIHKNSVRNSVAAWIGHAKHADTWELRRSLFQSVTFSRA